MMTGLGGGLSYPSSMTTHIADISVRVRMRAAAFAVRMASPDTIILLTVD